MVDNGPKRHYFISYSRRDLDIAKHLKKDLEEHGFEIWIDENIEPGIQWHDSIEKNIQESIAILYLVSPTSRTSSYVYHELDYAKIYKISIIPIWIRGEEWTKVVAFGLSRIQHIDIRLNNYNPGIEILMQTLKNLSKSKSRFTLYLGEKATNDCLPGSEDMGHQSSGSLENDDSDKEKNDVEVPQPSQQKSLDENDHFQESHYQNPLTTNQMSDKEREMLPKGLHEINQLQRNPYKGLRAFEYKDAKDFFGREKLIREMVQHIKDLLDKERRPENYQIPRCMMVVGASGSGKSSVVMAGLLPALEDKRNIPNINRWFLLQPVRPGEYPIKALAQAFMLPFLNENTAGESQLKRWSRADLRQKLGEPESRGLNELLQEITDNPNDRIVLIVDQFEEIFAPTVHPEQREQFIDLLMATATEPDTPILFLFTLRADFYDHILNNDTLSEKVKQCRIDIPLMTREELRSVIEKPVQHSDVNVTFDPNLAEDLLYEVRKRPASLPLLQFTLEQLFEHRDRKERRLTRQSYDEIGGLQGAVDKHAEDIYNHELHTPQHQAEARKLFTKHFIYIAESRDGATLLESGEEITRRRVTQAELQHNDSWSSIRSETIDAFVNARLLTVTRTVRQSTTDLDNITDITYEISHEVLLNAWGRLRKWIEEDRAEIYWTQSERYRIQSEHYWIQSVVQQAKQWNQEENPKKKNEWLLEKLSLRRLQEYRQHNEIEPSVEELFKASLAQQRRQKIGRFLFFVSIATLVILSLVLGPIIRNVISPDPTIVTSLADSGLGTLPYALQRAGDGATITFDTQLSGQTIYLTHSGLDIKKSITLRGPIGGINISSGTTGNYITIGPENNVTIDNMTFTNSYTLKHSMIVNAGNLTVNNSRIVRNKSYDRGGAIYNTGNLILNNTTIEGNMVSTDGGAIYNLFGTLSISNSTISDNEAYSNGGGLYSQGGAVTIDRSHISSNSASNNLGGGIAIINGSLSIRDTQIDHNYSDYTSKSISGGFGGGIAVVGSVAFISKSVITANRASAKGGGIVVAKDPDNGASSLLKLQDIIHTENHNTAYYYIGQNLSGSENDNDIAGNLITTGTNLQIFDDASIDNLGSPPNSYPVEKSPNYLGVANINDFCLKKGNSYGKISTQAERNATDIMFTCFNQSNRPVGTDFSGQEICQSQYSATPRNTVIDRMANYDDPTSLQCYKNLKPLGSIGQDGFAKYCASQPQYTGLFDNSKHRQTAYDWLCAPRDASRLPSGLSVTDACNLQYDIKDAVDRLANYNSIDGWECWEPT